VPARIRHFFHTSENTTARALIGQAYDTAKSHSHDLLANAPEFLSQAVWRGRLDSVVIQTSSWAGGTPPTTLDMMISSDSDGDVILVPTTTATLEPGVTTANIGGVAYKVDCPLTIVAGAKGDSTIYVHFKCDSGTLTVDVSTVVCRAIHSDSFEDRAADGLVTGTSIIQQFGTGPVDSTERQLRGTSAAASYTFLDAAVAMEVVCANANDTAAGTGAREVFVDGIDGAGAVKTETIATNGGTVALSGTWLRINRCYVTKLGSSPQVGNSNAGAITVQTAGGGAVHATIPADQGQSEIAGYAIPAGKVAHIHGLAISMDTGKSVTVKLYTRNNMLAGAAPFAALRLQRVYSGLDTPIDIDLEHPIVFDELTDIIWTAFTGTSAQASISFHIVLRDKP
jgi:hypothetical protein